MIKIDKETALQEFNKWFESKKLRQARREGDGEVLVDEMISAIMEGDIVIDEENNVIQKLHFPLPDPANISELKFKNRIHTGALMRELAHVKQGDSAGRQVATIAALTGEVGGTVRAMDSTDFSLSMTISAFY